MEHVPLYILLCPRPLGGGIKRWCCLTSVWRLSVVYIGPKSRTERPKKTKIGTVVVHVTRDSDTIFKVKKVKGQDHCRPLWLVVLAGQHGHRVSNRSRCVYDVYCVTTCRPGRGILWRPPAYSCFIPRWRVWVHNGMEWEKAFFGPPGIFSVWLLS